MTGKITARKVHEIQNSISGTQMAGGRAKLNWHSDFRAIAYIALFEKPAVAGGAGDCEEVENNVYDGKWI